MLIVETGNAAIDSESFCSVADATTYHSNRGNASWLALATDELREQALRKATDYLEKVYSQQWQGLRVNSTQALSFPRHSVVINHYVTSSSAIPQILINAQCELALKAAAGELLADQEKVVLREKVGSLEVEYSPYSRQSVRYTAIESLLRPLLANQSSVTAALLRA